MRAGTTTSVWRRSGAARKASHLMTGRGSRAGAARLLCAAASAALANAPALAQAAAPPPKQPRPTEPAELDPNAPLAPLPDLGIEWPDLNAKDSAAPPAPSAAATPAKGKTTAAQNGTGDIRYTVAVEGLGAI